MSNYTSIGKNNGQSIPNSTWTTITNYNDEYSDSDNCYTGGESINIKESGVYIFFLHLKFASNTSGQRSVRFIRDLGTANDSTGTLDRDATGGKDYVCHSWPAKLTAGQKMAVQTWQSSGSNLNVELAQFKAIKIH